MNTDDSTHEKRLELALKTFRSLSEPLLREKERLHMLYSQPRMRVSPEGVEALPSTLPSWAQALSDTIDAALQEVMERCLKLHGIDPVSRK